MLTSIAAAVVILGLLVVVHEAGHFLVAKRSGVRVLRFSIGYPPKLFGFRRGETEYAIGATPFGGYVRMLGDEVADELGPADVQTYLREIAQDLVQADAGGKVVEPADLDQKLVALARAIETDKSPLERALGRSLRPDESLFLSEVRDKGSLEQASEHLSKSPPAILANQLKQRAFPTQSLAKRLAIVLAGPLANIAFAPVLLAIVFLYGVPKLLPVIGKVSQDLPAYSAGLREGDHVIAINGHKVVGWDDLSNAVKESGGAPLKVEYQRQTGQTESLEVSPKKKSEKNAYGESVELWVIGVMPRGDTVLERVGPVRAVGRAFVETGRMATMMVVGIAKIVEGATPVRQALGGPIMIAQLAGREAHEGFANIAMFTVMLSIELGIINLFPIPMLDGGHILFFVIEGLRGKPLQLRHREIAQQVGLFLLAVLMAFVIFNDISRIVQG